MPRSMPRQRKRAAAAELHTDRLVGMLIEMARIYRSAKNDIVDAAERVILRDGPRGVSVEAVLAESGMSKGGFFHHFPTKEALLGALLERLAASVGETAAASMERDPEPFGRSLRAQIALAFDMPPRERKRTRALVLALLAAAMESREIASRARATNERALSEARADGVDLGVALVVELALDGFFLGESFGSLKLDAERKAAIKETLLELVKPPARGARRAR